MTAGLRTTEEPIGISANMDRSSGDSSETVSEDPKLKRLVGGFAFPNAAVSASFRENQLRLSI